MAAKEVKGEPPTIAQEVLRLRKAAAVKDEKKRYEYWVEEYGTTLRSSLVSSLVSKETAAIYLHDIGVTDDYTDSEFWKVDEARWLKKFLKRNGLRLSQIETSCDNSRRTSTVYALHCTIDETAIEEQTEQ